MKYLLNEIAAVWALPVVDEGQAFIQYLVTDSRTIVFPEQSLFFAIKGPRRAGSEFIADVYQQGVRYFVVDEQFNKEAYPDAYFFQVPNTIGALQQLAAHHRAKYNIPVIGITGSNGKTIVKEWLYHLLQPEYTIVRSPRSYNSQIGVPLSVWQINEQHTLGIFEAGISTTNEMEALANIIQPTIGIFTNITDAHNEGFANAAEKTVEKSKLFSHANVLIEATDYIEEDFPYKGTYFCWGVEPFNDLIIDARIKIDNITKVIFDYGEKEGLWDIPFEDTISTDNVITCISVMLYLNYSFEVIQERILQLRPVEMRMQLHKAVNNCSLINDSYSNDKFSFSQALNFLREKASEKSSTVILSDIVESGQTNEALYSEVVELLKRNNITKLYAIGEAVQTYFSLACLGELSFSVQLFATTQDFLNRVQNSAFNNEYILLKGARKFEFERIAHWLQQQVHQTVLEVNLTAMVQNLKTYQALLQPKTKLMAMVKAFSYGSGAGEVAKRLQQQKVDYLAVAYADEGVELRKAGIHLPIMVMSADEQSFDVLVNYSLEPEIFSFEMLHAFQQYIQQQGLQQYPVHIKLNTGMNRLGFDKNEIDALAILLANQQALRIKSVLSHLVASEDPAFDSFTKQQADDFATACTTIAQAIGYSFIKHIANTSAIQRNEALQFNMVRLGIGLYGIDTAVNGVLNLATVATLKSTVAQVRKVPANETVGYGRAGKLTRDSIIATIRIGYADGYSRRLGNGVGKMYLRGAYAPVVGKVCMDMTMIDITDIPQVNAGDIVEIFGEHITVQQLAKLSGTIAYEIMTGISQRVKRVYMEE